MRTLTIFICSLAASCFAAAAEVSAEDILSRLQQERPRLLIDSETVRQWRSAPTGSGPQDAWRSKVHQEALELLRQPVVAYPKPGVDMLNQSRQVMRRTYLLGYAYLSSGDRRFSERLWQELEAAGSLESWRPEISFLATAEMMHAFAIGYDWLYDTWTPEQREFLREAIVRNGLQPARAAYDGRLGGFAGWRSMNNWNFVCNASIVLAASAVLPAHADLATGLITDALTLVRPAVLQFGPDGEWEEGVTYWNYATRYLVLLLRGLQSAYGTDFALLNLNPGLAQTGDFPIYLTGPTGRPFDFADAENRRVDFPVLIDLAALFNQPAWAGFQVQRADGSVEDLMGHGRLSSDPAMSRLPLDRHFRGAGVVSFRSSWTDPNANFVAMKAGRNGANHGHLDLGGFIFEALGHRWIHEIEKPSYALPGFFNMSAAGNRWKYYAMRAEGHNTVVINPTRDPDQCVKGRATVEKFETLPEDVFAVVDLTNAYPGAASVRRGIRLADSRNRLLVRDEIRLPEPGQIAWGVHVKDPVELSAGGRTATLKAGRKRLTLRLVEPSSAVFEVGPAASSVFPPEAPASSAPGLQKISVKLSNVTDTAIVVWFEPSIEGAEPLYSRNLRFGPLESWEVRLGPAPVLMGLRTGERELGDFVPYVFTYTQTAANPVADLKGIPDLQSVIVAGPKPADAFPQAWFLRTGPVDKPAHLFRVIVERAEVPLRLLPTRPGPRSAKAEAPSQEGFPPENVLDGSTATRWSAEGKDVPLVLDFETEQSLAGVALAFWKGTSRSAIFSMDVSPDGRVWTQVIERARSSGKTSDPEVFAFERPLRARYLRFRGHGNDSNAWNSVSELVPLPELPESR